MRLVNLCPTCGGARHKRRAGIDEGNRDRFYRFSKLKYGGLLDDWMNELQPEIVACDDCGHHWYLRQPSPEQLSLMYASGRPLLPGTVSREPTSSMIAEMRRLANLSGKTAPRLLDFGSGFGRWARAAARTGLRVYAYEPSEARGAESVDEFTLVHDLAEMPKIQFDLINLEQVLEHVPAPLETLEQLKAYISPETILRVRVPNILRPPEGADIWKAWPYDGKRVHIMAPFEHLHGFVPLSLIALLNRSGFKPLPLNALWRQYPVLATRNLINRFYPPAGQTMLLAKL